MFADTLKYDFSEFLCGVFQMGAVLTVARWNKTLLVSSNGHYGLLSIEQSKSDLKT